MQHPPLKKGFLLLIKLIPLLQFTSLFLPVLKIYVSNSDFPYVYNIHCHKWINKMINCWIQNRNRNNSNVESNASPETEVMIYNQLEKLFLILDCLIIPLPNVKAFMFRAQNRLFRKGSPKVQLLSSMQQSSLSSLLLSYSPSLFHLIYVPICLDLPIFIYLAPLLCLTFLVRGCARNMFGRSSRKCECMKNSEWKVKYKQSIQE